MRDWIDLFENLATPADGKPYFEYNPSEDFWEFRGFDVWANLVGSHEDGFGIMEFGSNKYGSGNTVKALRWLKEQSPRLHVYDPGDPRDASTSRSFSFWQHMADKGLVDSMEDQNGNVIFNDGKWL